MLTKLPNILTFSRILAIPLLIGLLLFVNDPLGSWLAFIADTFACITDFFDGADTIDLDELFDALNTDGPHDGDYEEGGTERTDALMFSEDGDGNLVLTIDDTKDGDFEHFSITFLGLDSTDEAAVLAAIVTE